MSLTQSEIVARDTYLADEYAKRSKRKGDYWFRMWEQITGDGDYIPGRDDGEPMKGEEWN